MEVNRSEPWLLSLAFVENGSSSFGATNATVAPVALLKGCLLLAIILLAISGNLMVLLAVFLNANLRTATNCLIVNLALADLLLGASVLPFSAALEIFDKQWYFGQIFCHVWAATDVLCCTASINSLCVISVDRYIGVTRPLTYSSVVTHRRALFACVLVWLLSAVISVGPLLGWREPPPADPFVCEVTKQTGYVVFSVSFSFYIPTLVILVLYYRIYKAATRQTKFLRRGVKTIKGEPGQLTLRVHTPSVAGEDAHSSSVAGGRLAKFKRQKKAAKTLGIVVGVFIVCWFPFFFMLPLGTLCEPCTVPPLLFDFCFWTGYFNSCLNPFIYASTSREYNRAFHAILHCQWNKPSFVPPDSHHAWSGNTGQRTSRSGVGSLGRSTEGSDSEVR
ncbi:alpha-1A adrenergic receptor-like [Dermacentor andersoni]|uniref:alpha-1A adrenergic receptor-like n=1 Tax=Dermacentor andersoni TaxID=34620 RepID=UPI002155A0C1|nr:alpha-1A adrenergic receptor-like [Dermacentor andersoni]